VRDGFAAFRFARITRAARSAAADALLVGPLRESVMEPGARRKGEAAIFAGMAAGAASLVLRRFGLDFLSGVSLGISLAMFFLGFRALYRR